MKRFIAGVCLAGLSAMGADYHFSVITNGVYNVTTNWVESAVPSAADTAYFTGPLTLGFGADAEIAKAVFGGTQASALNSAAYLFRATDAVDVGPGATDAVTLRLLGGTYAFSQIFATNVVVTVNPTNNAAAGTGSNYFNPGWGTLTSGGGIIRHPNNGAANNVNFYIGTQDGQTFTWNITGGVTRIETYNANHNLENVNHTHLGGPSFGMRGVLNVSGAGTILTNTAFLNIGAGRAWGQYGGTNCQLNITGGAKVYANGSFFGFNGGGYSTTTIDGAGSEWNLVEAFAVIGKSSWGNRLIVTNGGYCSVKTDLAVGQEGGRFNELTVAGAGSKVYAGKLHIGEGSNFTHSNTVYVVDGGYIYANSIHFCSQGSQVNGRSNHEGNRMIVSGAGSFIEIPSQAYYNGSNNWLYIENGAKGYIYSTPGGYRGGVRVDGVGTVLTSRYCYAYGEDKIVVTNGGTLIYSTVFYPCNGGTGESVDFKVTGTGSKLSIPNNSTFRMPNKDTCAVTTLIEKGAQYEYNTINGSWGATIGYTVGSVVDFTVTDPGSSALFRGGTIHVAMATGSVVRMTVANGAQFLTTSYCDFAVTTSNASSVVTIAGAGSVWSNTASMTLGRTLRDSSASLVFKADAAGLGTMFVDAITVADTNSLLRVDLTDYKGPSQTFTLVDYGSLSAPLATQVVGTEYTGVINQAAPGTKIVLSVFRRGTLLKLF